MIQNFANEPFPAGAQVGISLDYPMLQGGRPRRRRGRASIGRPRPETRLHIVRSTPLPSTHLNLLRVGNASA